MGTEVDGIIDTILIGDTIVGVITHIMEAVIGGIIMEGDGTVIIMGTIMDTTMATMMALLTTITIITIIIMTGHLTIMDQEIHTALMEEEEKPIQIKADRQHLLKDMKLQLVLRALQEHFSIMVT